MSDVLRLQVAAGDDETTADAPSSTLSWGCCTHTHTVQAL